MTQNNIIKLTDDFIDACMKGDLNQVKYILASPDLKEHADSQASIDKGFQWACANGRTGVVEYLLTSKDIKACPDIHANRNCGLELACQFGHLNVVRILINETESYNRDNIKNIALHDDFEIKKEEVIEMIKARDLKNQLLNELPLNIDTSIKNHHSFRIKGKI